MATITTDLICNLNQPVAATFLHGNLFSQDNAGNTINVHVMDNGEPATIGGTVSANVIRADGNTVAVSGSLSGNQCSVVLPQACYAVPGRVEIIIKLTQSTTITTIAAIVANVYRSTTDTVVDPGTIIPSIQALIEEIEDAVDSIPVDYSGLLATIAANYSSSKTYQVGQYAWQGGVLKRCIVPITTAETYTAAHWTNAVIGDDLSALKSAIQKSGTLFIADGWIVTPFVWAFGWIGSDGQDDDSSASARDGHHVRMPEAISFNRNVAIHVDSAIRGLICTYEADGTTLVSRSTISRNAYVNISANTKFRLGAFESTITSNNPDTFGNYITITTAVTDNGKDIVSNTGRIEELEKISYKLNPVSILDSATWVNGFISANGVDSSYNAEKNLRCSDTLANAYNCEEYNVIRVVVNEGYKTNIYWYGEEDGEKVFISRKTELTGIADVGRPYDAKYVRFMLYKADASNISTTEKTNISIFGINVTGRVDPDDFYCANDIEKLKCAMLAIGDRSSGVIEIHRLYDFLTDADDSTTGEDLPLTHRGSGTNNRIVFSGFGKGCGFNTHGKSFVGEEGTKRGQITFENLRFFGGGSYFICDNIIRVSFENCTFSGGSAVIAINANDKYIQSFYFHNCIIRDGSGSVFSAANGQIIDLQVSQCMIEANTVVISAATVNGIFFSLCCIEGNRGEVLHVTRKITNAVFTGCYFESNNPPQDTEQELNYIQFNLGALYDTQSTQYVKNTQITISNNRFHVGNLSASENENDTRKRCMIYLQKDNPENGYVVIEGNYLDGVPGYNLFLVSENEEAMEEYTHVILRANCGDPYDGSHLVS